MILPALALALAAKPGPAPLTPTGPWIVRAEENLCLLEHQYVLGDRKVSLAFQPLLDLDEMEVFVFDPGQGGQQYTGGASARIGAMTRPFVGRYLSTVVPGKKIRLTRLTLARSVLDMLNDGDALWLQAKPLNLSFAMVGPEKARIALDKCISDLKKSWGIDPAIVSRAVSPLEGMPEHYLDSDSYPAEALSKGIYGRVIAFLNIDTSGAVSNCRIVSSAGKELNEATCTAARRIRFKPPLDGDNKPLPSTYILPVRWLLPGMSGDDAPTGSHIRP